MMVACTLRSFPKIMVKRSKSWISRLNSYDTLLVVGAFLAYFIVDGLAYSFGIIYTEIVEYFEAGRTVSALVPSVLHGFPLIVTQPICVLISQFGSRRVAVTGALITTVGYFLAGAVLNSIWTLILVVGFINGFGNAMIYNSTYLLIAYTFEKRRGLITGIVFSGSGFGTLAMSPILRVLLNEYGWTGTFMMIGGFHLNVCVCAMFYLSRKGRHKSVSGDRFSPVRVNAAAATETEASSNSAAVKEWRKYVRSYAVKKKFVPLLIDDRGEHNARDMFSTDFREARVQISNNVVLTRCHGDRTSRRPGHFDRHSSCNDLRFDNSLSWHAQNLAPQHRYQNGATYLQSVFAPPAGDPPPGADAHEERATTPQTPPRINPPPRELVKQLSMECEGHHSNLLEKRIFGKSGLYQNSDGRKTFGSVPLLLEITPSSHYERVETLSEELYGALCKIVKSQCTMFRRPEYCIFCVHAFLTMMWMATPLLYLPDAIENRPELSAFPAGSARGDDLKRFAAIVVAVVGVLFAIGTIVTGFVGDLKYTRPVVIYGALMSGGAVFMLLIPMAMTSRFALVLVSASYMFLMSSNYVLLGNVLIDIGGGNKEHLTGSFAAVQMLQGVAVIAGGAATGHIFDTYGSYDLMFYIAGACVLFSGLILFIVPTIDYVSALRRGETAANARCCIEAGSDDTMNGAAVPNSPQRAAVVAGGGENSAAAVDSPHMMLRFDTEKRRRHRSDSACSNLVNYDSEDERRTTPPTRSVTVDYHQSEEPIPPSQ